MLPSLSYDSSMIRFLAFYSIFTFSLVIGADDYSATHEETYWFVEKEFDLPAGFYQGSVRSNLNWGERLSLFLFDEDCGDKRKNLHVVLWSYQSEEIKKKNPNFKVSDLEDLPITLDVKVDGQESRIVSGSIWSTSKGQLNQDVYLIVIQSVPEFMYEPRAKFLTLSVRDDDPLRKYFDGKERQYRMEGFVPVWFQLTNNCINRMNSIEAKSASDKE